MRLTSSRAILAAFLMLAPAVPTALAQSADPSAEPSMEQVPAEPAEPAEVEEAAPPAEKTPRTPQEIYSDLTFFGEVFDRIREQYVDAPDEQALIRAAIKGMLTSLDPHSMYLDPAMFEDVQEGTSGQFEGLGIEVTMEQGAVKVVSPIDGTPAYRAGILANDYIVEIDGKSVQGMTLDEAVKLMRGPIGSQTRLTIVREGAAEPLYFDVARDVISQRVVRHSMERDGVAYIRLSRFTEQAFPGLQAAVKAIFEENKGAPKGIILDLRNNGGGLVDQAVSISDAFLKQGAIVLTRGRDPEEATRYEAVPDDLDARLADVPLIVLINGGSASASEIVAGALQDLKRATLVGTRSFGKGSVQSIMNLGPNGGIQMTTARYYTPSNRSIQASGIQPDILLLENVPEELLGRDTIMGEAGLDGQIGGGTQEEATTGSSAYVPPNKEDDTQLQYAIKLILGEETNDAYPPRADD
jgi:carboxyl-terminal processing protease